MAVVVVAGRILFHQTAGESEKPEAVASAETLNRQLVGEVIGGGPGQESTRNDITGEELFAALPPTTTWTTPPGVVVEKYRVTVEENNQPGGEIVGVAVWDADTHPGTQQHTRNNNNRKVVTDGNIDKEEAEAEAEAEGEGEGEREREEESDFRGATPPLFIIDQALSGFLLWTLKWEE